MGYRSLRAAKLYWPTGKAVSGLGGERAVVHWHAGVSEVYPIEVDARHGSGGASPCCYHLRDHSETFLAGTKSCGEGLTAFEWGHAICCSAGTWEY
jgi:hypothetical protein